MKMRILTKPIEVLVGDKDKYGLKLRQLTMGELESLVHMKSNDEMCTLIDSLIIEWVNKPALVDEDEKEVEFETLTEFRNLTTSNELLMVAFSKLEEEFKKKAEFTKK